MDKSADPINANCPAIIAKTGDEHVSKYVPRLLSELLSRFPRVAVESSVQSAAVAFAIDKKIPKNRILCLPYDELFQTADFIVSLGGDGTLLRAAQGAASHGLPVLGINLGTLGFLVEIMPEKMSERLDAIFSGDYFIEERQVLRVDVRKKDSPPRSYVACNDLTIKHSNSARIIELDTYIDGKILCELRSDGLIIATPTGSTAYSLSCNGPLVQPTLEATLIVPICPHTLTFRPLVVASHKVIKVIVSPRNKGKALVSIDGQVNETIDTSDHIIVKSPSYKLRLVQPLDHDYFKTLRTKLRWGRKF